MGQPVLSERCEPNYDRHRRSSGWAPVAAQSPTMQEVYARLARVAEQPLVNVLIVGETGVGKDRIVEELHRMSVGSERPLRRVDCSALSDSALETRDLVSWGSASDEAVESGRETVLLEGVEEIDRRLQSKLVSVLDSFDVHRSVARGARSATVRFVTTTSRSLNADVADGRFRSDLFFRINGVSIVVPPLRERPRDIAPLARCFLEAAALELGLEECPLLSPQALARLEEHCWPGNVRELRNVVDRALLLRSCETISASDWVFDDLRPLPAPSSTIPPPMEAGIPSENSGDDAGYLRGRFAGDRERIVAALETCHGNQTRAALLLGMPRRTLVAKLTAYAIPRPRKACGT